MMAEEKPVEPTKEFLKHHSVEKIETRKAGQKRTRVTDQRWLDYYLKHGHINNVQFMAGERLLRPVSYTHLTLPTTMLV